MTARTPNDAALSAALSAADRYLVVGNPIAHSRSPEIHAAFARQTAQAISYDRLLVPTEPADAFDRAVGEFAAAGGLGVNVTLPFKERAFAYAARHSERALLAGAVNTLAFREGGVYGDNTDGAGLVADLQGRLGISLAGKSVLLLGAGGAARGVLISLMQAGVAELTVANRTLARAQALVAQFNESAPVREARLRPSAAVALHAAQGADLVINATSSGVLNAGLRLPPNLFRTCALAYDCVYGPQPTAFMEQALEGGARQVSDGLGMLVEQAAESFLIWRGVRPLTAPVYRILQGRVLRGAAAARAAGAADGS